MSLDLIVIERLYQNESSTRVTVIINSAWKELEYLYSSYAEVYDNLSWWLYRNGTDATAVFGGMASVHCPSKRKATKSWGCITTQTPQAVGKKPLDLLFNTQQKCVARLAVFRTTCNCVFVFVAKAVLSCPVYFVQLVIVYLYLLLKLCCPVVSFLIIYNW